MSDGSTQHADNELQGTRRRSPALIALKAFTSQWFLIPQGTGIIGVILHNLGYQFDGLKDISRVFWVLTILLLVGFLVIYTVRAFVFPQYVARQLSSNIMETACMASISITFTTIIQMISLNLVADWGQSWGMLTLYRTIDSDHVLILARRMNRDSGLRTLVDQRGDGVCSVYWHTLRLHKG